MTVLDLYCGRGGWAAGFLADGWRVVGVDCDSSFSSVYPGEFICADVLTWLGWRDLPYDAVVSSSPCEQFSRWSMPWTRARNPPLPDLRFYYAGVAIAKALRVPSIHENVRGAQSWLGRAPGNCGPFYLWGDVPPVLPDWSHVKSAMSGSDPSGRAVIPYHLALHVARCFRRLVDS